MELQSVAVLIHRGFDVIVNDMACLQREYIQIRFPKSKKKRIRKKFTKDRNNYGFGIVEKVFKTGNKIIVSQRFFDKLKNAIK